jgi:thymidylate kinase
MINLVEGLNCSGKSTFIKYQERSTWSDLKASKAISTPYLNPRRWNHDDFLSLKFQPQISQDYFLLGAYIGLMEETHSNVNGAGWRWWDRTWISAYVYGSLSFHYFRALAEYLERCEIKYEVYYMDTPVKECQERLALQHSLADRYYVYPPSEWEDVDKKFRETLDFLLKDFGVTIHLVTGIESPSYAINTVTAPERKF